MATDSTAMDHFRENPSVSRRMVELLVRSATGQADTARAWRKLVSPTDRVGIKVNAAGGKAFATRLGVVRAIIDGLGQAGVSSSNIVVWDRSSADLKEAGFDPRILGCKVRGIDPPKGWDRTAVFAAPALGRLIWGDLLFVEKNAKALGKTVSDADQLSSNSYFSTIVTKEVTKIINVPTLCDDAGCGVAGAFYNVGVRNLDNWRRFVTIEGGAADSIPEIYADPNIGSKVVLNVLDGLIGQYAGGPEANPNYAFSYATIYASTDPVAIDATAARLIEDWRKLAKLPPIGARIEWLKAAEQMGLGVTDESRIKYVPVTPP